MTHSDLSCESPHSTTVRKIFARSVPLVALTTLLLAACATPQNGPLIPEPLMKPARQQPGEVEAVELGENAASQATTVSSTPTPPGDIKRRSGAPVQPPKLSGPDAAVASIALENMPIAQFAQAVFGGILERNVAIDPQVVARTDMVTFRTGKPQSAEQIFAAASALLRSYGIVVNDYNSTVRVMQDNTQNGMQPDIRRGRASAEVPAELRPVFFLVELENISPNQVTNWLRTFYQGRLTVQDDVQRNAVLLSGQSDTVQAAKDTIALLDQPLMRGRISARITPVFWSADEMAKRLAELLQAEGYSVAVNAAANTPVLVLPIATVNSVIVFASNQQVLDHVVQWAKELDQTPSGRAGNFISYRVRNTDATELAQTLSDVMGMNATPTGAGAGSSPAAAASARSSSRVVVNPAGNTLIIKTTPAEFQQWYALLQELDRPARSALIMVTVAELSLKETESFGFQWMIDQFKQNGYQINMGNGSSVASTASNFFLSIASGAGDPRVLLQALATDNRAEVISNPSLVARNGQDATIQVGQQVPILTSQVSNANTGGTTGTGILQTVEYRNTGVILKVRPVIHAGGRIDLDISQEVSSAQVTDTGVSTSPTIATRKVDTKLSVSDGATILLGGLMTNSKSDAERGLPYLKDIPVLGNVFKTSSDKTDDRTELVILLTPYVIEDDYDAEAITREFRNQFGWAQNQTNAIRDRTAAPKE